MARPDHNVDVAIIGGGVAGAYCAYRLSRTHPDLRIGVFESSDRIGGRIWSARLVSDAPPVELGAMSFSAAHENVMGLTQVLGLETARLRFFRAHHFIRGRVLSDDALAQGEAFNLAPEERGKPPLKLLRDVLAQILGDCGVAFPDSGPTRAAAHDLRKATIDGQRLHQCGFWNLLSTRLSQEAHAFLSTSFGASSVFHNANAYDAAMLLWGETAPQPHYRLMEGFQKLPAALLDHAGRQTCVRIGASLSAIEGERGRYNLVLRTQTSSFHVRAQRIVLALPQRALQAVQWRDGQLRSAVMRHLETVVGIGACKLFLRFDTGWPDYRDLTGPHDTAAAYTDSPARQIYFFGRSAAAAPAIVLAAYADGEAADYWSVLARSDATDSDALLEAARAALSKLHPVATTARAAAMLFADWRGPPHAAAWHAWRAGVRSWEVVEQIRKPSPDHDVVVCGEAYAQQQGWVEGAINNAEMMLERHFGVSRPHWVRPDYPFEF